MITLETFRATKYVTADIGEAIGDAALVGYPGLIYLGCYYIETGGLYGNFTLLLERSEEVSDELAPLEEKLFAFCCEQGACEDGEVIAISDPTAVERLAADFARLVEAECSPEQFAEIKRRNATQSDCCATHDFMDANMPMHEAFKAVFRRDPLPEEGGMSQEDTDVWNAAWSMARKNFLSD